MVLNGGVVGGSESEAVKNNKEIEETEILVIREAITCLSMRQFLNLTDSKSFYDRNVYSKT